MYYLNNDFSEHLLISGIALEAGHRQSMNKTSSLVCINNPGLIWEIISCYNKLDIMEEKMYEKATSDPKAPSLRHILYVTDSVLLIQMILGSLNGYISVAISQPSMQEVASFLKTVFHQEH